MPNLKTILKCLVVVFAALPALRVDAQTQCNRQRGPDVIVGDLLDVTNYASFGGIEALAIGTYSCNVGNQDLPWVAGTSQHPVIGQNFFRLKNGRFEQVGQAWLKHGFTALTDNICGCGCNGHGGAVLGIGCADPYCCGLNGDQTGLGPKNPVNAHTGAFPMPYALPDEDPGTAGQQVTSISGRLQVHISDIDSAQNGGGLYFVEGQYVTPDDAAAGNQNNNASYRAISVSGTGTAWTFSFPTNSSTQREKPGITAWRDNDTAAATVPVTLFNMDVPMDGRMIVGYKVTSLGGGVYHYEFAVQNLNSDRSARSFSVPISAGAVVTNVGFHDVDYHTGEPFSGTDWTPTVSSTAVTWATQTITQNANANALRWGTLYNFRFDCNAAPTPSHAAIGLFKPGPGPGTVYPNIVAPADSDCNTNMIPDALETSTGAARDCNTNHLPDDCEAAGSDCNNNGTPDACESLADCNTNGTLDACELTGNDCNNNGVLDLCESTDCNTNGVRDVCEIAGHDCDHNGVLDACQPDCNTNNVPDACENLADCNSNGKPDICDVLTILAGTANYATAANLGLAILDFQTTTHSQTVPPSGTGPITDVNVTLNLTHSYVGDLNITLAHSGTTVTLWDNRCLTRNNMSNLTFDDASATSSTSCPGTSSQPISGTRRPATVLSAFNGAATSAAGQWMLSVSDTAAGDTGILQNWTLTVTRQGVPATSADVNHNNVPDECECMTCRGDMNGDAIVDAADIQPWVNVMIAGTMQPCADLNASGQIDAGDLTAFVTRLTTAPGPCP